jgi:hypothetical protein
VRAVDDEAVALVFLTRLVELGVEEFSRPVVDALNAAAHRRAVDVAIEDVHEHRHARQLGRAHAELARRHGRADEGDDAVGGTDDQPVVDRRDAGRIAEEEHAPGGQDQADPEQWLPNQAEHDGRADEARYEGVAFAVDRHERAADAVDQAHRRPVLNRGNA